MNNSNKFALVTGASSGLGIEFARQLADRGYDLILTARRKDRLEALRTEILASRAIRIEIVVADLSRPSGAQKLLDHAHKKKLNVEVLINNAGYGSYGPYSEKAYELWEEMLTVNVNSLLKLTSGVLPLMLERGFGRILFVSSVGGFLPVPQFAVYAASKAFVLHYTEALSVELAGRGVQVTALCPGPTATAFFEVASEGRPVRQPMPFDDPGDVVRAGLDALEKGRPVVVTGWINKIEVFLVRFAPRLLVARASGFMMKRFRQ